LVPVECTVSAEGNGGGDGEAPVKPNYLIYDGYLFEVHKGANSVELYIEGAKQDVDVGWKQELTSPRPKFNVQDVERENYPDDEKIEVTISVKNKRAEKARFASAINILGPTYRCNIVDSVLDEGDNEITEEISVRDPGKQTVEVKTRNKSIDL
jgi:hypothetical protein